MICEEIELTTMMSSVTIQEYPSKGEGQATVHSSPPSDSSDIDQEDIVYGLDSLTITDN